MVFELNFECVRRRLSGCSLSLVEFYAFVFFFCELMMTSLPHSGNTCAASLKKKMCVSGHLFL